MGCCESTLNVHPFPNCGSFFENASKTTTCISYWHSDILIHVYGSETWPITVANRKRLEEAHYRWLMRILHVSWRDKITNKSIRERTGRGKWRASSGREDCGG